MKTRSRYHIVLSLALLSLPLSTPCKGAGFPDELFTRAERTHFTETSLHNDVMAFVRTLSKLSDLAHLEIYGKSVQGRGFPLVVMADPPVRTPDEAKQSGKTVIYIQGNIHAGEVEGKEASMEIMREIAFSPKRALLSDQIVLFGPNYNPDGNDALGQNRPSQDGSPLLTGTRSSGEGYDLNRDGLRCEAVETKAMIKHVINKWNPVMFIDLHTTNGSWHGYPITYAPGNHTAGHPGTTDYLMNTLFPAVTDTVRQRSGMEMFLYGNFDRGSWPPTQYSGTPHMPRFLTNSMALKNKLAILVETFAHDRFDKRILSNKVFLYSVLEYTNAHGNEIRDLINKIEHETIKQITDQAGSLQKGIRFEVAQLGAPSDLLVYETVINPKAENSRNQWHRTGRRVWIDNVKLMQKHIPTQLSTVPRGYVFPAELSSVADKLKEHGVQVDILKENTAFTGEEFTVTHYSRQEREYQKHHLVTIEGHFHKKRITMPKGSFVVDLAQAYAYLIFYALEPEADDGLTVWNYFDDYLIKHGVENGNTAHPVFKYYSKK
jgi:hypothetical protein